MEEITEENVDGFLDRINRLEGGCVEKIEINLEKNSIFIIAYPEGAFVKCEMKLFGVQSFNINDPSGVEFIGLSGYPSSLEVTFDDRVVLIAIGANEALQDVESLKKSNFYVCADSLYATVRQEH